MTPVVIFVHIHYVDTWLPIRERLQSCMTVPFRLVLTTTAQDHVFDAPNSRFLTEMRVVVVENRGRDVRPFLEALRAVEGFEIGLKLHGKKSVHRLDGDAWRDALTTSLLPAAPGVKAIVDAMMRDSRLALVVPEHALCSIDRHIGRNMGAMRRIAGRMNLKLSDALSATPYFPAGTMFWFRRKFFGPVLDLDFDGDFAVENRQTDGTMAHAFERMFAVVAEQDGGIAVPTDALPQLRRDMTVGEIRDVVQQTVDMDASHVRRPGRLGAFALRYLWFITPIYAALPEPVRRRIKAALERAPRAQGPGLSV